jgi:hypothetical protein
MNKMVSYDGIGYVAATFKVDSTTKTYLEANKVNPKTGNVDINDARLAVKLNSDGTVGFGASTPTAADAVFGVIIAYEMDGFATVQTAGYVEGVPTAAAINAGVKTLAVNNAGVVSSVESTDSAAKVIVPSASTNLFATLKF